MLENIFDLVEGFVNKKVILIAWSKKVCIPFHKHLQTFGNRAFLCNLECLMALNPSQSNLDF